MSEYTPDTDFVSHMYTSMRGSNPAQSRSDALAEFHRWLDQIRAEVWNEGYYYATNGKWGPPEAGANPYGEVED